jgi:hypothetical protein
MTLTDLANLVADMRIAQKEYFRTRSGDVLEHSKSLERKVDQAVCLTPTAWLR